MKPIENVLIQLIKNQPWFASLALRWKLVEEPGVGTLGTDGSNLFYSDQYFQSLTREEQQSAVMHETLHCAFLHFSKAELGGRDKALANQAQDFQINAELKECGFPLAKDWLYDERFQGMTWQAIYTILEQEEKKNPKPKCGCVRFTDGPPGEDSKAKEEALERAWTMAVAQAFEVSRHVGKAPASLQRQFERMLSVNNWRDTVARYLSKLGDVQWMRPNKRLISQGIYLPGSVVDSLGTLALIVDTSGSVDAKMLSLFGAEVNGILQVAGRPERVVVLYCDAEVNHVEEPEGELELKAYGGGGTAFQPAFDWLEREGIKPDVCFYLTDLYGDNPQDPGYPVIWVAPISSPQQGPFGETIKIDMGMEL